MSVLPDGEAHEVQVSEPEETPGNIPIHVQPFRTRANSSSNHEDKEISVTGENYEDQDSLLSDDRGLGCRHSDKGSVLYFPHAEISAATKMVTRPGRRPISGGAIPGRRGTHLHATRWTTWDHRRRYTSPTERTYRME